MILNASQRESKKEMTKKEKKNKLEVRWVTRRFDQCLVPCLFLHSTKDRHHFACLHIFGRSNGSKILFSFWISTFQLFWPRIETSFIWSSFFYSNEIRYFMHHDLRNNLIMIDWRRNIKMKPNIWSTDTYLTAFFLIGFQLKIRKYLGWNKKNMEFWNYQKCGIL